jgi:hypothetical protein
VQLGTFFCALGLAFVTTATGQAPRSRFDGRAARAISRTYQFSVASPHGWFEFENADGMVFFNYRAEQSLPQGEFPPGGASINIRVRDTASAGRSGDLLPSRADHAIQMHHGVSVERGYVVGPKAIGVVRALRVSFDQVALSADLQSLHFVTVFWDFRGHSFEAELSYGKGDPRGGHDERVLLDLVRSVREEKGTR